ncbi:BTAD domain-containing putative transcriptional regulator [Streptomyces longwoodensis]|uniref:AfsR/SARP family transcriptional regulator n=1 Tax=Streptomyces longwoodensis TaxID=68231 RepID=UPI00324B09C8
MTPHPPERPVPAALRLLGGFGLHIDARPVYVPPTAQKVLVLLALHREGTSRERAAELLWPDLPRNRATAGLRSALWRLSRRSDRGLVADLDFSRPSLAPHVDIDLHSAATYATALASDRHDSAPGPDVPPQLRDELLPSWYDDWLVDAREHFHQTRLHALEAISRRHRRAGRRCEALVYAMTAVEAEPLRESAHREVTAVHLGEGNVAEALRHFDLYRRRLRRELGLPPSPEFRRLLAPHLGRPADASPPRGGRQRESPGTPRR